MKKLLLIIPLLFLFTSCLTGPIEDSPAPETEQAAVTRTYTDGMVEALVLHNPYSLENVRRMMEEEEGVTRSRGVDPGIVATHYHVRFRPTTDEQCNVIKNDYTIDIQPYPYDVDVPLGAVSYIDHDQPADTPAFIFAMVPSSYSFPQGLAYDILDSLYYYEIDDSAIMQLDLVTPEIDPRRPPRGLFDVSVEYCDFVSGGSGGGTGGGSGGGSTGGPFKPSGTISVWDDLLERYVPLQGVKVKAKRNGSSVIMTTDANGRFSTDKTYEGKATYSIIWETGSYDIRAGIFGQAFYNGPTQKTAWNLLIGGSNDAKKSIRIATIHRAAYRYFYKNIGGLLPAVKHDNGTKIKISYRDTDGVSKFNSPTTVIPGIYPDILIFRRKQHSRTDRPINEILKVTYHELGHVVHCLRMGNGNFWQATRYICESWADYVSWHLAQLEYSEQAYRFGLPNSIRDIIINGIRTGDDDSKQCWPYLNSGQTSAIRTNKNHSPIFIDLVDDFNQNIYEHTDINGELYIYPNDEVTGYTSTVLNQIVLQSYGVSSLKSKVKSNKPSGVTDKQIDNLFLRYEELW